MSLPVHLKSDGHESGVPGGHPEVIDEVILATAGYDHTIKFWKADTGQCIRTLQHADSQVNALEISPDGQLLAAAGYQHIRMFDVHGSNASGPVVNYEGVSKNVMSVGFHEASQWMFTGGEDGTARTWDLRMRNLQCQCIFQANAPVNSVVLHPNQHELVVGDQNGVVHIWDMRAKASESYTPEPGASIQCVAIDPTAKYIACTTNKATVYVSSADEEPPPQAKENEVTNGNAVKGQSGEGEKSSRLKPIKKIDAHKRYALRCKFSPDSTMLVTSSADKSCRVWRTSDFGLVSEMTTKDQRWVWDIAFSADSRYLFTASSDNVARLWSLPNQSNDFTPQVTRVYDENGHQKAVTCLAFRERTVVG